MLNIKIMEEKAVPCLYNQGLRNAIPQAKTIQADWLGDNTHPQNCTTAHSLLHRT